MTHNRGSVKHVLKKQNEILTWCIGCSG